MRRALVLVSVLSATTLGTGLTLAAATAAAPGQRPQPEIERGVNFDEFHVDGFGIELSVNNNDGEVSATMTVHRGQQVAYYTVPAAITAKRVTAKFGAFGELDYTYKPKRGLGVSAECLGAPSNTGEAEFDGTFTFTGEQEYVHIDAAHLEGSVVIYPMPRQCARGPRARRAVPYSPSYSGEGVTLSATTRSRGTREIRTVSLFDGGGKKPHKAAMFALLSELQEGMTVSRGVVAFIPSRAFRWNLDAGTASVHPPAPFTGSAKFTRGGQNGPGTWTGALTMPVLGGEPVELAGSAFRATIHKGVPQDE